MKIELTKKNPVLSQIRFVLAARARSSSRHALGGIIIDPDCFWCSDSHVLHVLHCYHQYEVGHYEVMKSTQTSVILLKSNDNLRVPDWRSIVPFYSHYIKDVAAHNDVRFTEKVIGALYQHDIGLPVERLIPLSKTNERWDIFFDSKQQGRSVKFISSNYQNYQHPKYRLEALIMPYGLAKPEITTKAVERHNRKIT